MVPERDLNGPKAKYCFSMDWDVIWLISQFPARIPSLGTNPPFEAISAIKIAHFWTHTDLKWYPRET